jgi:hypothetical protein
MTDTRPNHPFADGRPGTQRTLSLAEAYRLQAHARRLQGEAMAGALRGASALLLGACVECGVTRIYSEDFDG